MKNSRRSIPLTDDEIRWARYLWSLGYPFQEEDREASAFAGEGIRGHPPGQSWLRRARQAQFLSADSVAKKLGISRAAYSQLEKSEEVRRISLAKLAVAAEAMGCELVYGLRPRSGQTFSESVWQRILVEAIQHPWMKACDPKRKGYALRAIAWQLMMDAQFRRRQGWAEKRCRRRRQRH